MNFIVFNKKLMKKIFLFIAVIFCFKLNAQNVPCNSDPIYRQFDFWIGEWEAFNKAGKKAGDSKIELILDSCIIFENWKSVNPFKGLYYSGKSFNTYNAATKQWQQTWVDNVGSTTEYSEGHF